MIPLVNKQNVDGASADYPFGRPRDKTVSLGGTPSNLVTNGDWHQFFEKLMSFAGVTPNGLPDNEYSGWQLMEALMALMGGCKTTIIEIGSWDMDTTATVNIAHGLTLTNIRAVEAFVYSDSLAGYYPIFVAGIGYATTSDVTLTRDSAGLFDSTNFNDAGINRGFIVIRHIEDL